MSTPFPTAPSTGPFDEHIGYQLRRASNLVMTTLADRLDEIDLTVVETSVLVLIDHNPGIFQSEIGRLLGIRRANVVPLAASLERRRLVFRTPAEGRMVGLSTTTLGVDIAARAETIMRDNDNRLFGAMSAETCSALRKALEAIWRGTSRGDE